MKTTHLTKCVIGLLLLAGFIIQATPSARTSSQPTAPAQTINIRPNVPADITPPASLQNAAIFAWQEFIALNWPAVPQNGALNTRDTPDPSKKFGDPGYNGPLVWHTFRGKVEIFPGMGNPPGYVNSAAASYGYDAPPKYIYSSAAATSPPNQGGVGTPTGQVLRFNPLGPPTTTPWINLDENSEIGLTTMYAGIGAPGQVPGKMILFLAKANRVQYNYVVGNKWWTDFNDDGYSARESAISNTQTYIADKLQDPPAGSPNFVSFPYGTIELKSAWRQLTPAEIASKRFYMTTVRYYRTINTGPNKNKPGYVDAVLGLLALHINQKTPSAPYFIYATFSQADNLLDENGNRIEDENGNLLRNQNANPLDPMVVSQNATSANPATPSSIQQFTPRQSPLQDPQKRLFYVNTSSTLPPPPPPLLSVQGKVALNKRIHNIPPTIISANQVAHAAIAAYNQQQGIANSPWLYYKLVNVQYQPYDKPAGITYTGTGISGNPDPSTYYQSNEVVETDYILQVFSGQFQANPPLPPPNQSVNAFGLITDYNNDGAVFKNVSFNGKGYLMGGCMGCHGNAQVGGKGFSFIFGGGPVASPQTDDPATGLKKFINLFAKR
jgi:hypothetical protein